MLYDSQECSSTLRNMSEMGGDESSVPLTRGEEQWVVFWGVGAMGGIYLINEPVALVQLSSLDKDYSHNMVSALSNLTFCFLTL